jgi:hypothetical protein
LVLLYSLLLSTASRLVVVATAEYAETGAVLGIPLAVLVVLTDAAETTPPPLLLPLPP